jgi:hypothetical protein
MFDHSTGHFIQTQRTSHNKRNRNEAVNFYIFGAQSLEHVRSVGATVEESYPHVREQSFALIHKLSTIHCICIQLSS